MWRDNPKALKGSRGLTPLCPAGRLHGLGGLRRFGPEPLSDAQEHGPEGRSTLRL